MHPCSAMIDSALNGYNGTAIGTATCLVTVRGAGPSSDAVGTAVAGVLNTGAQWWHPCSMQMHP